MRIAAVALCVPVLAACEQRAGIDGALADATRYLVSKQSADGAWRSETYGAMAGGATLTPPVLKTLWMLSPDSDACARATAYLRGVSPDRPLDYPVYTAAMAAIVFHLAEDLGTRDAWLDLLRGYQVTEQLGWSPKDPGYGGWGYAIRPPRKPEFGEPPFIADLSSTLFAVGALRMSGVPADDPAIRAALIFVERCQNYPGDGGFFFTTTNPAQNKAGVGPDGRYHSYGSATADGVRALVRCGLPADHPRVQAAQRWLQRNFSTETNPGVFEGVLAADRDAALYYWSWSVAHAFRLLAVTTVQRDGLTVAWAPMLAQALTARQRPDGSWANPHGFMKEDDPIIATTLAAAALANCRGSGVAHQHRAAVE